MLEHLAALRPSETVRRKPLSRHGQNLRFARCCYDHLAGQLGVAVTQALQERQYIASAAEKVFLVTQSGSEWFRNMGLDVTMLKPTQNRVARQCLDWTERQHHLAGPLGVQFMALLCSNGWLQRSKSSRAVEVTPKGWASLKEQLGINQQSVILKSGER